MIYATNRCQSRCRHCSIWQKPNDTLSKDEIVSLMSSRCISRNTTVGLEGKNLLPLSDIHATYKLLSSLKQQL